jgi:hypothetical protein
MGVRLSTEDQEAYLRHWCCVGAGLGVQKDLLPGYQITETIWLDRARPGNRDGRELTRSLYTMLEQLFPELLRGVVTAVMRRTVGVQLADSMLIPRDAFWDRVLGIRCVLYSIFGAAPDVLQGLFGDPVQEATALLLTERKHGIDDVFPAQFVIPGDLKDHWKSCHRPRIKDAHLRALAGVHARELGAKSRLSTLRKSPLSTPLWVPATEPDEADPLVSETEIEEWAAQEQRRREAWLNGPTADERADWARRERERRMFWREGRLGRRGNDCNPLLARQYRVRQLPLAAKGAMRRLLNMSPNEAFDTLVRAGRDQTRARVKSSGWSG